MDGWLGEWIDGWVSGLMGGWMDGHVDGWIVERERGRETSEGVSTK